MESQHTLKDRSATLPTVRRRLLLPNMSMGPSALLAETACSFACDIVLEQGGRVANAKSLMSLLTLEDAPGDYVNMTAHGEDAHEAIETLAALLHSAFSDNGHAAVARLQGQG